MTRNLKMWMSAGVSGCFKNSNAILAYKYYLLAHTYSTRKCVCLTCQTTVETLCASSDAWCASCWYADIIYFASAAVAVHSSHITVSSSVLWSRFSPPSNVVNGHMLTVWFMVCRCTATGWDSVGDCTLVTADDRAADAAVAGYHYGTFSCESCKGFFKRTVQNSKTFVCRHSEMCVIGMANRKKCPACRFARCREAGMRIEGLSVLLHVFLHPLYYCC